MSELLIVLYASSVLPFHSCMERGYSNSSGRKFATSLELVSLGPGFNSISPDINNDKKVKIRTVTVVFLKTSDLNENILFCI